MLEALAASAIDEGHADTKDFLKTKWQYAHDRNMQMKQAYYQRGLNTQMSQLSAEARRSSASDMVEGLKRAGLSPALASGTQFGSVSSGGSVGAPSSSPAPSSTSGMGKLALEDMKYKQSERDLMAAQARNLNADAQNKEIDASNKVDANNASSSMLKDHFQAVLDNPNTSGEEKAFARAMLNGSKLSVGALDAYNKVLDAYPKQAEKLRDKLKAQVEGQISFTQLMDKEFPNIVAQLPKKEVEQIDAQTKKLASEIALLDVESRRKNADIELIEKQKSLIDAQIRQIGQMIKATHNKDFIDLWDSGQYMGAVTTYTQNLLPSIMQGVGILLGARTLKGGGNPAFGSVKTSTPMEMLGY